MAKATAVGSPWMPFRRKEESRKEISGSATNRTSRRLIACSAPPTDAVIDRTEPMTRIKIRPSSPYQYTSQNSARAPLPERPKRSGFCFPGFSIFGGFAEGLCTAHPQVTADRNDNAPDYEASIASSAPDGRESSYSSETEDSSLSTEWNDESIAICSNPDSDEEDDPLRIHEAISDLTERAQRLNLHCEVKGLSLPQCTTEGFACMTKKESDEASPPPIVSVQEASRQLSQQSLYAPRSYFTQSIEAIRSVFSESSVAAASICSDHAAKVDLEKNSTAMESTPMSLSKSGPPRLRSFVPLASTSELQSRGLSRLYEPPHKPLSGAASCHTSVKTERIRNTTPVNTVPHRRTPSSTSVPSTGISAQSGSQSDVLLDNPSVLGAIGMIRPTESTEKKLARDRESQSLFNTRAPSSPGKKGMKQGSSFRDGRRYSFSGLKSPMSSFDDGNISLSGRPDTAFYEPKKLSTKKIGKSGTGKHHRSQSQLSTPLYMYRSASTASEKAHMGVFEMGERLRTISSTLSANVRSQNVVSVLNELKRGDIAEKVNPGTADCAPEMQHVIALADRSPKLLSDRLPDAVKAKQNDQDSDDSLSIQVIINQVPNGPGSPEEAMSEMTPSLMTELSSTSASFSQALTKSLSNVLAKTSNGGASFSAVKLPSAEHLSQRRGAGPIDIDEVSDGWNSLDSRRYSRNWKREVSGAAIDDEELTEAEESLATTETGSFEDPPRLQTDLSKETHSLLRRRSITETIGNEIADLTDPDTLDQLGADCTGMRRDIQTAGPAILFKWFG